jgi:hypothetical protein
MTKRKTQRPRRRAYRQRGGNVGAGYSVGGQLVPGLPLNNSGALINNIGNCRAVTPSYTVTPPAAAGLPGFGSGMRGGAYTFNLAANPMGAALSQGGIPEATRLGCQGTIINPLNPGPHTPVTQPPGGVNQWALGAEVGKLLQTGGMSPLGQAAVSEAYIAPTAGYANTVSSWRDSVGAPVQLQLPYDARIPNPACTKTGGARRRTRKARGRKGKKTRGRRRQRGGAADKAAIQAAYETKIDDLVAQANVGTKSMFSSPEALRGVIKDRDASSTGAPAKAGPAGEVFNEYTFKKVGRLIKGRKTTDPDTEENYVVVNIYV